MLRHWQTIQTLVKTVDEHECCVKKRIALCVSGSSDLAHRTLKDMISAVFQTTAAQNAAQVGHARERALHT